MELTQLLKVKSKRYHPQALSAASPSGATRSPSKTHAMIAYLSPRIALAKTLSQRRSMMSSNSVSVKILGKRCSRMRYMGTTLERLNMA